MVNGSICSSLVPGGTVVKRLNLIVCALVLWSSIAALSGQTAQARQETDDLQSLALIDSVVSTYADTTSDLSAYTVSATFTPYSIADPAAITGDLSIKYHNRTGATQDTLYLRLYPNNAEYADGRMDVSDITIDGETVLSYTSEADTTVSIPLPDPVADGDWVELKLAFTTIIPTDPTQSYGMFKFDTSANTYNLAHWLPLLAGWDEEAGWNTGPISINGDPVFTEAATFDVTLSAPADLIFAGSGSPVGDPEIEGDTQTLHFVSGPSRDFDLAASSSFQVTTAMAGETEVRSFAMPGFETQSAAVLETGVKAIGIYNDLIGTYPYRQLDIVQADIGNGAGGVEFPGMVFIGSSFYSPDSPSVQNIPHILEFIVVHEVAHQWFYGVVGNDQYLHAYLDEALSNYLSVVYFAAAYDAETANEQANYQLRAGYFDFLFNYGDDIVDQPTDAFRTGGAYGVIVYGKGALAFMELRAEIGTDAFFAALQQYFVDYAFAIATPTDMQTAFEEAADASLDEFWTHWFKSADGKDDYDATDYARLLREMSE